MVDLNVGQSAVVDCGLEVFSPKSVTVIDVDRMQLLCWIVLWINLMWWIVSLWLYGLVRRDGHPWRMEVAAVVDCNVKPSAVMHCGLEVLSAKKFAS